MALTPKIPTPDKQATQDEVFLREVDDAVREGDFVNFWKKYGRILLAVVITGLIAFAIYIFWQNRQQAAADAQSEAYIAAIDAFQAGDEKGGRAAMEKLVDADQPGYRAMAQIILANIDADTGNAKKAAEAYARIAADDSLPQAFRDMALIRQVTAEFDSMKPEQVLAKLKPLAQPGHPWFGSAGELTAMAYLKMGKEDVAGPIFAQIAGQEDLPPNLRARATQMAGALGVDAVQLGDGEGQLNANGNAAAQGEN